MLVSLPFRAALLQAIQTDTALFQAMPADDRALMLSRLRILMEILPKKATWDADFTTTTELLGRLIETAETNKLEGLAGLLKEQHGALKEVAADGAKHVSARRLDKLRFGFDHIVSQFERVSARGKTDNPSTPYSHEGMKLVEILKIHQHLNASRKTFEEPAFDEILGTVANYLRTLPLHERYNLYLFSQAGEPKYLPPAPGGIFGAASSHAMLRTIINHLLKPDFDTGIAVSRDFESVKQAMAENIRGRA